MAGSYLKSPTVLLYWLKPVIGAAVIGGIGVTTGVGFGVGDGGIVTGEVVAGGVTTGDAVVAGAGGGGVVTTGDAVVVVTCGVTTGDAAGVEDGGAIVDDVATGALGDSDFIAEVVAVPVQPASITVITIIPISVENNFLKITNLLLFYNYSHYFPESIAY